MALLSLFPVVTLYLFCFFSNLLVALPTARFIDNVQTLPARDRRQHETQLPNHAHRAEVIEPHVNQLRRRGLPGAVYICTEDNFRGDCAWTAPDNRCHIAGTGNNSARSIGPDEGGFCILFEKATCTGNEVKTLRFPGQASDMPTFGALQCYPDQSPTRNSTGTVNDGTTVGSEISPTQTFGKSDADPRLAGGAGSMERKGLKDIMAAMEQDGFSEGMIGLKKGHYY